MVDQINVMNKSASRVYYKIPNSAVGATRIFYPQQAQMVPVGELIELGHQPGGPELIYNYLYISDPEVLRAVLNLDPEPEYWLTEDKIPNWMVSSTLDEFIDGLNFAPKGTRDLITKIAVEQELNDFSKREAIKEILHYDVTAAIENARPEPEEEAKAEAAPERRTTTTAAPARRTTQSKIIIPNKSE